jgi:hypothetical protein
MQNYVTYTTTVKTEFKINIMSEINYFKKIVLCKIM